MKKRMFPLTIGEVVFDSDNRLFGVITELTESSATLSMDEDMAHDIDCYETNSQLWDKEFDNEVWVVTNLDSLYQMAWGLVDSRNENPICYEHNKTRDNYPYYNPFLDENLFGIETKYDNFYDSFIDKDMSLKDKLNAIRNLKNVEINIEDLFID